MVTVAFVTIKAKSTMSFDLEDFLPYRLYEAAEQTSRAFYDCYHEIYELKRTEWRVMFNVGLYAPISAVEISKRSNLDKTKISRAVFRLEERAWLQRIYLPNDRRRHDLELTKEGRKIFLHLANLAAEFNGQLQKAIGKDTTQSLLTNLIKLENANVKISQKGKVE